MKRSRFAEERIIAVLREQEAGVATAEICRKHAAGSATFYAWKAKYGGLVSDPMLDRGWSPRWLPLHLGRSFALCLQETLLRDRASAAPPGPFLVAEWPSSTTAPPARCARWAVVACSTARSSSAALATLWTSLSSRRPEAGGAPPGPAPPGRTRRHADRGETRSSYVNSGGRWLFQAPGPLPRGAAVPPPTP